MSRHLIRDAFVKQTGLPCQDVHLKYIAGGKRGGKQSEYTFLISGRDPFVIVWDEAGDDVAIAAAAAGAVK